MCPTDHIYKRKPEKDDTIINQIVPSFHHYIPKNPPLKISISTKKKNNNDVSSPNPPKRSPPNMTINNKKKKRSDESSPYPKKLFLTSLILAPPF